jgi:hypothetical protein
VRTSITSTPAARAAGDTFVGVFVGEATACSHVQSPGGEQVSLGGGSSRRHLPLGEGRINSVKSESHSSRSSSLKLYRALSLRHWIAVLAACLRLGTARTTRGCCHRAACVPCGRRPS